jgi:anti-sigma factor RsiW
MRCSELTELLDLYIDDGLSDEERARVERHLMGCAKCAHRVRAAEQARELLREAYPREETSPGFRERTEARLRSNLADVLQEPGGAPAGQWRLPLLDD